MTTTEIWGRFQEQFKEILFFLPTFFKKPIDKMKYPPKWDWGKILILHIAFGAVTGFIRGLIELRLVAAIFGAISSVFSALVIGGFGTMLVYFFIVFLFNRKEDPLKIYTVVALASLPMFVLRILGPFDALGAPANLLGFALMCMLLTVSLVEVFRIPRQQVVRWMGGLFAIAFVIWASAIIRQSREDSDRGPQITPETIDVLKKEFGK
jgi:hypothetical protein